VNYPFKFLKHPLSEMVKVFHIVFAWIHVPETNKPDFKINKNALGLVNCQKDPICRAYVTTKMVLRHKTRHAWMDC